MADNKNTPLLSKVKTMFDIKTMIAVICGITAGTGTSIMIEPTASATMNEQLFRIEIRLSQIEERVRRNERELEKLQRQYENYSQRSRH